MPTVDDVAKHAGVSPATVSRVLNGSYKVKTERHDKVMGALEELGYALPKKLVSPEALLKIVVITNTLTKQDTSLVEALQEMAHRFHMSVVYKLTPGGTLREDLFPQKGEYDGIILCDVDMEERNFRKLKAICPVVLCRKEFPYDGYISVSIDDERAGYDLTISLIRKGFKNIFLHRSFLHEGPDISTIFSSSYLEEEPVYMRKRLMGYMRAFLEAGLEIPREYAFAQKLPLSYINAPRAMENGEVEKLFNFPHRPDAVIVRDYYVLNQLKYIAEGKGLRVPEDIIFASFDPPVLTDTMSLPYINQPYKKIAELTLKTLRDLIMENLDPRDDLSLYVRHSVEGF